MNGEMVYGRQPVLEVLRADRREIRRLLMARKSDSRAVIRADH